MHHFLWPISKIGITFGNEERKLARRVFALVTNHRQDRPVDQVAEVNEMLSTPRLLRCMWTQILGSLSVRARGTHTHGRGSANLALTFANWCALHMSKLSTRVHAPFSQSVRDSGEKVTNLPKKTTTTWRKKMIKKREKQTIRTAGRQFIMLVFISSQPHQCASWTAATAATVTTAQHRHKVANCFRQRAHRNVRWILVLIYQPESEHAPTVHHSFGALRLVKK